MVFNLNSHNNDLFYVSKHLTLICQYKAQDYTYTYSHNL